MRTKQFFFFYQTIKMIIFLKVFRSGQKKQPISGIQNGFGSFNFPCIIIKDNNLVLKMMTGCLSELEKHGLESWWNSGHGPNRIGRYEACLSDPLMTYNMVTLVEASEPALPFRLALCLPSQCSTTDIKLFLHKIFEQLKQNYEIVEINNSLPSYEYPYDWVFFLTLFLLLTFSIVAVVFSFVKPNSNFALTNSLKVFSYQPHPLNILNGIRAIAMFWVIFGHEHFFTLSIASNSLTFFPTLETAYFLFVVAGMFAVDIFFFLGGFMLSFVLLKRSVSFASYFLMLLNRLIRLWPSYLVAILIFFSFYMHLGSGPNWQIMLPQVQFCEGMWRSLLFVDNFVHNGWELCMNWGWYLQVDTQLFAFSALILICYQRNKMATFMMTILLIACSFWYTLSFNYTHHFVQPIHLEDISPNDTSFYDLYIKPWSRCPPYLIGVLLGIGYAELLSAEKQGDSEHVLVRFKSYVSQRKLVQNTLQFFGILIVLFFILIPRTSQLGLYWNELVNSLYLTYAKNGVIIGLILLLTPELLGCKTFLRGILDNSIMNFISKVSFFTYLIHINIITQWTNSRKVQTYFSLTMIFQTFISHAIMSVLVATWLTLIIEVPFSNLQKSLFRPLISRSQNSK